MREEGGTGAPLPVTAGGLSLSPHPRIAKAAPPLPPWYPRRREQPHFGWGGCQLRMHTLEYIGRGERQDEGRDLCTGIEIFSISICDDPPPQPHPTSALL